MGNEMIDQSQNLSGTNVIDSRCVVEFRPDDGWGGEYGFDWFRIGDCKELEYTFKAGVSKGKKPPKEKTINGGKDGALHYVNDKIVGKYAVKNSLGEWVDMKDGKPTDPDYPDLCGVFVREKAAKYSVADKFKGINKDYYWVDKLVRDEYKFFNIIGSDRNYIIPWITLFFASVSNNPKSKVLPRRMTVKYSEIEYRINPIYKTEATVKLIINAKNIKSIEFEHGSCLSISVDKLDGIENGKNTQHKLNIKCNAKFEEKHQSVKAFAIHDDGKRTFAGQINVECCVPRVMDVCFVNVKAKHGKVPSKGGLPGFNDFVSQSDNLQKYLAQAHVIPNISYEELEIQWDDNNENYHNNLYTSRIRGEVYLAVGENEQNVVRRKDGELWLKELGDKLEEIFNDTVGKVNAYKIFFLDSPFFASAAVADDSTIGGGLAGRANDIISHSTIIAKVPKDPSTVCHELLHCFGLYHSFSNREYYTYKKCMTSNIMDYHFLEMNGEKKYNCLELITLSLWQWRKIRGLFKNNEIDVKNNLVRVNS